MKRILLSNVFFVIIVCILFISNVVGLVFLTVMELKSHSEEHEYVRSKIEGNYDRQVAKENDMVYLNLFNIQGFIQEKEWIFLINDKQYLPGYYPIKKHMVVKIVNEKDHKEIAGEVDIIEYLKPGDFVCYGYSIKDGKEYLPITIENEDQGKEIEINLRTNLQEPGNDIQMIQSENF